MEKYLNPEQSQSNREDRCDQAQDEFEGARILAYHNGMLLKCCNRDQPHYQLIWGHDRQWLLNLYPSNQRLYHDPHRRGPYIQMYADWTLASVVDACWRAQEKS